MIGQGFKWDIFLCSPLRMDLTKRYVMQAHDDAEAIKMMHDAIAVGMCVVALCPSTEVLIRAH